MRSSSSHDPETGPHNLPISRVLSTGLLVSVALLVIGVVLTIVRPGLTVAHEASIRDIPGEIAALRPGGFFDLGLLALVATPAVGVAALLIGFIRRRMWLFALFSLLVLAVLGLSVYVGLRA
jgi:uncharacterized membrane protein